jgi:hypothetical protein
MLFRLNALVAIVLPDAVVLADVIVLVVFAEAIVFAADFAEAAVPVVSSFLIEPWLPEEKRSPLHSQGVGLAGVLLFKIWPEGQIHVHKSEQYHIPESKPVSCSMIHLI